MRGKVSTAFNNRFLRACAGERLWPPPAWIMRQAGRYLPEYREVRARHPFLEVCRTPELACEVTLQPLRRFPLDAAIVFSDIMMPLESMGVSLTFAPGPKLASPYRDAAAIGALAVPPGEAIAPYVMQTLRLLRRELKVPVIGFAGAPLTLAAYLVEGQGSKDFAHLRALMAGAPALADRLLATLGEMTLAYLTEQVKAGAQAVQVFDSWAGIVSAEVYRRHVLPPLRRLFAGLKPLGVPRIYFAQDAAALWGEMAELDVEVVGVDWRMPLAQVRHLQPAGRVLQGNLDPAVLLSGPAATRPAAEAVLADGQGGPHIFNLGHGILPTTPIAAVEAMLETVAACDGQLGRD